MKTGAKENDSMANNGKFSTVARELGFSRIAGDFDLETLIPPVTFEGFRPVPSFHSAKSKLIVGNREFPLNYNSKIMIVNDGANQIHVKTGTSFPSEQELGNVFIYSVFHFWTEIVSGSDADNLLVPGFELTDCIQGVYTKLPFANVKFGGKYDIRLYSGQQAMLFLGGAKPKIVTVATKQVESVNDEDARLVLHLEFHRNQRPGTDAEIDMAKLMEKLDSAGSDGK